jgi:DNA-binding NarL/FixJ family response regulator
MLGAMRTKVSAAGISRRWGVLAVEDDKGMCAFLEAGVRSHSGLEWLQGVGSVREALAWFDRTERAPDVLLVDLGLPDGTGLEVIRAAVARFPHCDPLVVSVFGDDEHVFAAIEAGAVGYLHKDAGIGDIAQAVLDVKAGAAPISPLIARRVLARLRSLQAERHGAAATPQVRSLLSAREQEVLVLIARGFSYAEIARLKHLSVHTVQTHIKNLYGKLAVHSKNEAVFEATRLGLLRSLP